MASTIFIFDLRIMDTAVDEANGEAVDTTNTGAVEYLFEDMKDNSGDLTLPLG